MKSQDGGPRKLHAIQVLSFVVVVVVVVVRGRPRAAPVVQERLRAGHGSQCGFCTPGFVMAMYALIRGWTEDRPITERDIDEAMQGPFLLVDPENCTEF